MATVITVDRGRYTCQLSERSVTAMRARELGRRGAVVGDRVAIVGDTSGLPGTLARIVRIEERGSVLRRSADDAPLADSGEERVIVANADQLVIVASLTDPPPRLGLIDRCLVAAYEAEITPLLCLTKADLPDTLSVVEEVTEYYRALLATGRLSYVVCRADEPPTDLCERLAAFVSVLCGHSGVGKSTLVNALIPGASRLTADVSAVGKGRHTSTSAVALKLPHSSGWVIDTPGVRSFGLAHLDEEDLLHGFPDLVEASTQCHPGCTHRGNEPECGLDGWVQKGLAHAGRLASLRALLESRIGNPEP